MQKLISFQPFRSAIFFFGENFAPFGSHLCSYKCLFAFIVGEIGFWEVEQRSGVYMEVVVSVGRGDEGVCKNRGYDKARGVCHSKWINETLFFNKIINSYLYFQLQFFLSTQLIIVSAKRNSTLVYRSMFPSLPVID